MALVSTIKQLYFLSDYQCPMFKRDGEKEIPEPFAEQARYFTECRLLQRDVIVTLEGVSNQLVYGSIKHPVRTGDSFEFLC